MHWTPGTSSHIIPGVLLLESPQANEVCDLWAHGSKVCVSINTKSAQGREEKKRLDCQGQEQGQSSRGQTAFKAAFCSESNGVWFPGTFFLYPRALFSSQENHKSQPDMLYVESLSHTLLPN